ncbi:glutathione S-transferase [Meredithblackwellia eburnea MCA 4105]
MSSPQFTLYSHASGPNGWKVAAVLKALGLTYETKYLQFDKGEHKGPEYTKFNPNGRIPALIDHHDNDFTVWESDAILLYLVEKYDPEHKLSFTDPKDKIYVTQWLFFQSSGQGPYFGQRAHFQLFAPEKVPYAIERYGKEILRVFGVLNDVLSKQDYLVGGKLSIADLSFIPWNIFAIAALLPEGTDVAAQFPAFKAWHDKLVELPYVKATYEDRAAAQQK